MKLFVSRTALLRGAIFVAAVALGAWLGAIQARIRFGPSAGMIAAFSEKDLFKRLRAGIGCIEGQGAAGCADLAALLERRGTAARLGAPELFRTVLYRWGQCDPHGALRFLNRTRQTDDLAASQAAILHGWLDADTRAALAWCRAHPVPEFSAEREDGDMFRRERRWRTLAEFNMDAARKCLEAGTPATDFRGVSPFLNVRQSPEATPWLGPAALERTAAPRQIPNFEYRWRHLVLAWAENEPLAAYNWLIRTQDLPVGRDAVLPDLLRRWFRQEPARVADLVVYENDGNKWLDGFQDGFALWAGRDPEGVLAWIRKLPERIADDSFKMRRAIDIADMNPDVALEIALEIKDPDYRNEIVEDCVVHCQKRFPTIFTDYMQKHGSRIPPIIKARVK